MRKQISDEILHMERELGLMETSAVGKADTDTSLTQARKLHATLLDRLRCLNYMAHSAKTHAWADKAGSLLAWLIRQEAPQHPILALRTTANTLVYTQREIQAELTQYYTDTYQSRTRATTTEITEFLAEVTLPSMGPAYIEEINTPITPFEIKMAISSLATNKTPGPDGLPSEFYKSYSEYLAPQLHKIYLEALAQMRLPKSQNEAILVSLLKPDKDSTLPGSYRPLALLNTDYKILAKLLADRLAPLVPGLVHPDQNGFVPARNTSLNIRRLFRVMEYAPQMWPRAGCLVLDLEKAFDSLEWPYLFNILQHYKLGAYYLQLVSLLYTAPQARVKTGNLVSDPITIHRGTRQGCPLSPLLFSLAMEPLAQALRQQGEDWGIQIGRASL